MHFRSLLRYLQVAPNSPQDDDLLIRVLRLLEILLTSPLMPPQTVVAWMSRIVLHSEGPLMSLLRSVPPAPQAQQLDGSLSASESKRYTELSQFDWLLSVTQRTEERWPGSALQLYFSFFNTVW